MTLCIVIYGAIWETKWRHVHTPCATAEDSDPYPGPLLTSGTPSDVGGATSVVDFVTSDHAFQISNQIINAISVPWNNKWNKLLFSLNLYDAGTKIYRRLIWSIEQISRLWDHNLLSLKIFLINVDKRLKREIKLKLVYFQDEGAASKFLLATAASGYLKLLVNLTAFLKFALIRLSVSHSPCLLKCN